MNHHRDRLEGSPRNRYFVKSDNTLGVAGARGLASEMQQTLLEIRGIALD